MAWDWLDTLSLLVFLCTMCSLIVLCAYDIFLWVRNDLRELIAVGSSFAVLVFGSVLLLSSRKIALRTSFADIPKLYVPINSSDLPKPVYGLVQTALSRSASIRASAKPLLGDIADSIGRGKPQSTFEGLHFRDAAICTFAALEEAVCQISDYLERDRRMTGRMYLLFLSDREVVSEDIAQLYIERYEKIRFSDEEMDENDYREFMKLFTALVRSIGVMR
ncbi:hypothetical protein BASA50_007988 [Batrachochytrium salamandrivorans]|uniref:Defect at low temperature protein 1 n=1 Tax=Batrachochytrium salamandrivorans TaxID=1357716 RepID=A0ABQ8F5T0_9FUNG|nr:hypothetical protein BASA50_007988 [Batrachochytrium salamandrivorans]